MGILIVLIRLRAFDRCLKLLGLPMARLGMLSVDLLFVQVEEDLDLLSFLPSLSKELVFGHILA